jgi:hypothetical protein
MSKKRDPEIYNELLEAFRKKYGLSAQTLHQEIIQDSDKKESISERSIRDILTKREKFDSARETTLNIICQKLLKKTYFELEQSTSNIIDADSEFCDEFISQEREWIEKYKNRFLELYNSVRIPGMSYGKTLLNISMKPLVYDTVVKRRKTDINILKIGGWSKSRSEYWEKINKGTQISFSEAIKKFKKLQVWGSAGAGKTIALKLTGIQLIEDFDIDDKSSMLPLFVDFNAFCKEERVLGSVQDLRDYVERSFGRDVESDGLEDVRNFLRKLWKQGRCIFLLDGLDEVPSKLTTQVQDLIAVLVDDFYINWFVISCRFGVYRSVPTDDFREVEMVDLDQTRIEQYVKKFFLSEAKSEELGKANADAFLRALDTNDAMRELARTPLLLATTCQLYQSGHEFPKDYKTLFSDSIDLFIRNWDAAKRVTRDVDAEPANLVKGILSLANRKALLARIAYEGFISKSGVQHAWEREDLEAIVKEFIVNVPGYRAEAQEIESRKVIRTIENQNGLLIQIGRSVYSYSHLAVQEYLAAEAIKEEKTIDEILELIDCYIGEPQWYPVIQNLTTLVRKEQDTAAILKRIFYYTVMSVRDVPEIQSWLHWLETITNKIGVGTPSWRACIAAYDYVTDLNSNPNSVPSTVKENAFPIAEKLRETNISLHKKTPRTPACKLVLDLALVLTIARKISKKKFDGLDFINPVRQFDESFVSQGIEGFDQTFEKIIELAQTQLAETPEIKASLPALLQLQEDRPEDIEASLEWGSWADRLSALTQAQYGTGHSDKLSDIAKEALSRYSQLNLLLADCLQNDIYCSRADREYIFGHLFLPSDAIPEDLKQK